MNSSIISQLIKKDWQLNQGPMLGYLLLGVAAMWLLMIPGKLTFIIGGVLLITVVIIIGIHMVISTVVQERKNQTLTFMMSLPVSYQEYSLAKLSANLIVTGSAWLILFLMMVGVIIGINSLPNGLLIYATLTMVYLLMLFVILLSVALTSESEAVTVVVMTIANVSISVFMIAVGDMAGIKEFIYGSEAVWNSHALTILGLEVAVIILALTITWYLQSRKRNFL